VVDLGARTASGAVWTYASYATGRAFVFLGMATVARLVSPDDYGLFNMAAVGISLLEGTYDLGLRRGLIYLGAVRAWGMRQTGFVLSLGAGALLTLILYLASPFVATFYAEPRVTALMQMLSVYFGIACLGVVPDAILQHRLAFNRRFWPAIVAPAGRYLIAVPLVAMGFGAWGLAWGQLIGVSLEVVLLVSLSGWRPRLGWSSEAASQLVKYSSQVSLVEWTAALGFNLDYLLVGHFLGATVLGLYTLAFKLPDSTIGAAGWVGSRVLLPALVQMEDRGDGVGEGFLYALRLALVLLAPLAAALCILTPRLLPLLFGDQWSAATPVVQLLFISASLNAVSQIIGAAFMAAGNPRNITRAQITWLAMLVPALYVTAQRSIVAVAVAHVVGLLVFLAVKVALVPRTLDLRLVELFQCARPGLLAACMMLLVLMPMTRVSTGVVLQLAAAGLVYGFTVWLFAIRSPRASSGELRVAMIIQSFYPRIGGAESNLLALTGPLKRLGIDVQIVTRRFAGFEASDCVEGAPVRRMPAPGAQVRASLTFVLSSVWLMLRGLRPHVIHAHELRSPTLAAVCAGLLLGRPVVAHVLRGGLLGDVRVLRSATLGRPRLWLFRAAVSRFVAVSRETQRELLDAGIPDHKIVLISYGVDTHRFRPLPDEERRLLRRRLGFEGRAVVLVVARLVPEKRFDQLLEAWPRVHTCVSNAMLVVAGDGPEREHLEHMASQMPDVHFVGELRDPLPFLQAADCLTLPSSTEGQPISLLEAMSTSLVCVGSDIEGISEALDSGGVGALFRAGDVASLANTLVYVLQSPESDRARLGAAARERVLQHHSIESNALALRRLYEALT
jgi:glycosyltransferase involved in cell wall biosynthesis/O-antigen/teichoic acid export membrane protein